MQALLFGCKSRRTKALELKSRRVIGYRDNLMQICCLWAQCNLGAVQSELRTRGMQRQSMKVAHSLRGGQSEKQRSLV